MADRNAESLSALMDSEAEQLELRRLLEQLDKESDVRARWHRYHVASSALGNDLLRYAHIDISASVRKHIDGEEAYATGTRDTSPAVGRASGDSRFGLKSLTGFALAASVTAAVFVGVRAFNDSPAPAGGTTSEAQLAGLSSLPQAPAADSSRQAASAEIGQEENLRLQRRLRTYMQLHAQQASVNMSQGMLPLARVASHDVE